MFKSELEQIKNVLAELEPFKDSSFVYDRWATDRNAFKGITDTQRLKTFAQVSDEDGRSNWSETKSFEYRPRTGVSIVCGISCMDAESVVKVVLNKVINKALLTISNISVDTNEFKIYKEETGKDLQDPKLKLVRIKFTLEKLLSISGCDTLICEDCC